MHANDYSVCYQCRHACKTVVFPHDCIFVYLHMNSNAQNALQTQPAKHWLLFQIIIYLFTIIYTLGWSEWIGGDLLVECVNGKRKIGFGGHCQIRYRKLLGVIKGRLELTKG